MFVALTFFSQKGCIPETAFIIKTNDITWPWISWTYHFVQRLGTLLTLSYIVYMTAATRTETEVKPVYVNLF